MRFKWPTEKMSCVNSVAMKQNMRIPIHKQTNRATFTNKNEPIIYTSLMTLLRLTFMILGTLMEHFHEGSAQIKSFVLKVNLVFATFLG